MMFGHDCHSQPSILPRMSPPTPRLKDLLFYPSDSFSDQTSTCTAGQNIYDFSFVHHCNSVVQFLYFIKIVRNQNDCLSLFSQFQQSLMDKGSRLHIQSPCRVMNDDKVRGTGKDLSEKDLLGIAAGEMFDDGARVGRFDPVLQDDSFCIILHLPAVLKERPPDSDRFQKSGGSHGFA